MATTNLYQVQTKCETGVFNFFTTAENHKDALKELQNNSSDWKNIVNDDVDLVITIKKLV